jgi:hypothetical protein
MMPDPAMMGGPPPPMMTETPPSAEEPSELSSPVEHLRMAIQHAQAALVGEEDDADSQALSKLVSGLYQILAARQKDSDQTMGNPSLLRTLRRSGS